MKHSPAAFLSFASDVALFRPLPFWDDVVKLSYPPFFPSIARKIMHG